MTICYLVFALPGVIMNGPIAMLVSYMSEHKRQKVTLYLTDRNKQIQE